MNRWQDKRVFLVGGPGGVGKTTLSAALGVAFAQQGHRTVVLTVDPARRLAQALGLDTFEGELRRIDVGGPGQLWASMLDPTRTLDRVIEKHAQTPEQSQRILGHPLYRAMVDTLGGSGEYAAMEQLLEFARCESYDRVIIDTPPSDNARELFEAPGRMADFMDSSVLGWFSRKGPLKLPLLHTGTRLLMGGLKRVFGAEFFEALSELIDDLSGMQAGFRDRNRQAMETLRSASTAFLLATVPSEARTREALSFTETLREKQIPLSLLILNQIEPDADPAWAERPVNQKILAYQQALHREQSPWSGQLAQTLGCPVVCVPRQTRLLQTIESLGELGRRYLLVLPESPPYH